MIIIKILQFTVLPLLFLIALLRAFFLDLVDWVRYRPPSAFKFDYVQEKAWGDNNHRPVSCLGSVASRSSNRGDTEDSSMIRYANVHAMSREQLIDLVYELKGRIMHLESVTRELGELRQANRRLNQKCLTFVRRLNRRDS